MIASGRIFLPFADLRKAVVSFLQKNVLKLVNRFDDQACPVKVLLGKLTALDMTVRKNRAIFWIK